MQVTFLGLFIVLFFLFFAYKLVTDKTETFLLGVPDVGKTVKLCTQEDGNCYPVQEKYAVNTRGPAADLLGRINKKNMELIVYMKEKYLTGHSPGDYNMSASEFNLRKGMIKNLLDRYDAKNITEHSPKSVHNTSYVYGKGKQISFCLRDRESGENLLHPFKLLYFVNLHEISHIAGTSYDTGHSTTFWRDFKILLQEAQEANLYQSLNYSQSPVNYCGITIDYNPLYDL